MAAPLILTVQLDEDSQQFFNLQRAQYFPPELNFIAAHLTLFHHLPLNDAVIVGIERICAARSPFTMAITEVRGMGKGVAYKVESRQLTELHKQLQREWRDVLTPQDRQGLWAHITVQNKVTPEHARRTKETLQRQFSPFEGHAAGLLLWEYLDGPWRLYRQFTFAG